LADDLNFIETTKPEFDVKKAKNNHLPQILSRRNNSHESRKNAAD